MKKILYGCAYYAEYLSQECIKTNRVEKDLKMMKEAGFNAIRIAESTWSTLEPSNGVFDFSYIDMVLKKVKKYDIKVIIGTPTYAVPSWLVKKESSILATTKNGQYKYGHRQLMDITDVTFLRYAKRVIEKLLEHVAKDSSVIGFQIDNETKYYDVSNKHIQKMFVEYLKEKYVSTDALNKAFVLAYWSNSIASFDDFPDMDGCVNAGLSAEYDKFRRNLVTKYLAWQVKIVEKYKKNDQFITHNLDFEWKKFGADIAQDGYSYGVQKDAQHYNIAKYLTIAGTDIYHPTKDKLTGAEISFCGDEIRCLKNDNYLVLECQAQAFKYWTPYPKQLRLHCFSHIASGASGVMYWNWHSIHNGYETYWKGILSHDLESNPVYEEIKRIGSELEKLGRDNLVITKKNRVALLVDNSSLTALNWFPVDKDLSYNDIVRWMYDSLYEINVECDVVFADKINVKKYEVIITPALYSVNEDKLCELERFVKDGGVLISSFRSFVSDEHLTVYHDKLPHILNKCFGMSYNQFVEPSGITVNNMKVRYLAELLKADKSKVLNYYEHEYWKEYACITYNSYGKGKTYYIGAFVDKTILKQVYQKAINDIDNDRFIKMPVIIKSGINKKGKKIHYMFNYSSKKVKIICPYENVRDILTGKNYRKSDVMALCDYDILVCEEKV